MISLFTSYNCKGITNPWIALDLYRKDLANIVRRRGYKFIKDLLASSSEIAMEGFDLHGNMNDEQNGIYVKGTGGAGQ